MTAPGMAAGAPYEAEVGVQLVEGSTVGLLTVPAVKEVTKVANVLVETQHVMLPVTEPVELPVKLPVTEAAVTSVLKMYPHS